MLYVDYNWDLSPSGILLDEEINVDKLGWEEGDLFRIEKINGRVRLVKVDKLVKFIQDGAKDVKVE